GEDAEQPVALHDQDRADAVLSHQGDGLADRVPGSNGVETARHHVLDAARHLEILCLSREGGKEGGGAHDEDGRKGLEARHRPAGGLREANAMMPPAHIPAASTCTTTARSSLGRTDRGAETTSPSTPASAATRGMRRDGFAHWIFGVICPRRLTTREPIAPRSP